MLLFSCWRCCEELLIRPRAPPDTARSKEHYANLEIYVPTIESFEEAWLSQPIVYHFLDGLRFLLPSGERPGSTYCSHYKWIFLKDGCGPMYMKYSMDQVQQIPELPRFSLQRVTSERSLYKQCAKAPREPVFACDLWSPEDKYILWVTS